MNGQESMVSYILVIEALGPADRMRTVHSLVRRLT